MLYPLEDCHCLHYGVEQEAEENELDLWNPSMTCSHRHHMTFQHSVMKCSALAECFTYMNSSILQNSPFIICTGA